MISLLWPEDVSRDDVAFSLDAEGWKDLELEHLARQFTSLKVNHGLVKTYLSTLVKDPEVLRWRQQSLAFLLTYPLVADKMAYLAPQLDLVADSGFSPALPPLQKVLRRMSELESWGGLVQGISEALRDAELPETGPWMHLAEMLNHQTSTEEFQSLMAVLPSLRAKIQGVKAISIGINLNHNLEAVGGVLLSVEDEHYTGKTGGLWGKLFTAHESPLGPLHMPPYKTTMVSNQTVIQDPEIHGWAVNPKSLPLFRDLEEVIKKTSVELEKQLAKFRRITMDPWKSLAQELSLLLAAQKVIRSWGEIGVPMAWPDILEPDANVTEVIKMYHPPLFMTGNSLPVPNDLAWNESGRIHIITGPNSGGKTVYLQSLGWAQVLGQVGWPLPAKEARLCPAASFGTHFQKEEETGRGEGRFGEELLRLKKLFTEMRPGGVLLMNESLSGTNALEGYAIAWDLMKALRVKGARAGFTTHLHELARDVDLINVDIAGSSSLASLCAQPGSFKVLFGAPAGRSLAKEMAQRHGITFEELIRV